jgi:aspartyl protease family protein
MRNSSFQRNLILSLMVASFCALPAVSIADECQSNAYSSPVDYSTTYPLTVPHADFSKTQSAATKGNALEQRNLAMDYESGYLVARCDEKAEYWYRRAAKGGDQIAKNWIKVHDAQALFAAGPECLGATCDPYTGETTQILALVADSRGHYHSDITVNDVTVSGIIDTGASMIAISTATAMRLGISGQNASMGHGITANGVVNTLDKIIPVMKIGNITLNDVAISILPDTPTLIGMSVLRRLKMNAANGQMTLSK